MAKNLQQILTRRAKEIDKLLKITKRKLLEFEILMSKRDLKEGKFKIYKKVKDLIKEI